MSEKEHRLFACWCARQVWHLLKDERSRKSVEVAERYAVGEASKEELKKARYAARDSARDAAWYAAMYVANDAAWCVVWCVVWDAANEVIESGEKINRIEVFEVMREAQVDYLRSNHTPKF